MRGSPFSSRLVSSSRKRDRTQGSRQQQTFLVPANHPLPGHGGVGKGPIMTPPASRSSQIMAPRKWQGVRKVFREFLQAGAFSAG